MRWRERWISPKVDILEGHIAGPMVAVLLALYAFGIGKAALDAVPPLAASGDGGPDAGQCAAARGGSGQRRVCLPC